MKYRTWVPLLLALVLGSPTAAYQDKPGRGSGQSHKWWQSDSFKSELGLTAQQSAEIEGIFQATLPKLRETWKDLDRLETALSKMVAEAKVDESQIAQQVGRVEAARSELAKTRTLMLYRMHRVLTPEQRVKLKSLHDQREGERRRPPDRRW